MHVRAESRPHRQALVVAEHGVEMRPVDGRQQPAVRGQPEHHVRHETRCVVDQVPQEVVRHVPITTCRVEYEQRQQTVRQCRVNHVCEERVRYVPHTTCKVIPETHCRMVPVTTCSMEPYTVTYCVTRCVPVCAPACP